MTIKTLAGRQVPNREIARQLDMTEGNVRYHLRRMAAEHDYACSLRSVQRYYRAHYPPPPKRARRRC